MPLHVPIKLSGHANNKAIYITTNRKVLKLIIAGCIYLGSNFERNEIAC